jgi:hypothetical protein
MSKVEVIEQQIEALSPKELSAFRRWFASFDAKAWDRELEDDASSGRLDQLADEALGEHRDGKTSNL